MIQDDGDANCFGKYGKGDLEFRGPNSLVVDDAGNMIVSDGLNYKLKVVSKHNEYLGLVQVRISVNHEVVVKQEYNGLCLWSGGRETLKANLAVSG